MRKNNRWIAAAVCVLLVSLVAAGAEPLVLDELHLIHWEQVPGGSPSFTGPVSAAVLMAWHAEHGYPALLPDLNGDGRTDEEDTILLARDFGEEMGCDVLEDRLADPFVAYPLARYVAERYPGEFRLLIYDESFPEEVERDLGQPFAPMEIPGIVLDVLEDPFFELYAFHLEAGRPGIVGVGFDVPEWNDFAVSRSYLPEEHPEGVPVNLVCTGFETFAPEPVWETLMRSEPDRWGLLRPDWIPFETFILLIPETEAAGMHGGPEDEPGDDPGDGPGGDPGDDPGRDPGDDPGDDPRYPGLPGGEPGDDPGGFEEGACCLPDGSCQMMSATNCRESDGIYTAGTTCAGVECPPRTEAPCAAVVGEITDICYAFDGDELTVYASYAIRNTGPEDAVNITAYALVGLNDGVHGFGGLADSQDWRYGLTIPSGATYAYDVVYTTRAPNLDVSNLTYLYGSLWLQTPYPWDCWPIAQQAFVQTWDPAPPCEGRDQGTPPGGSSDGESEIQSADLSIDMRQDLPPDDGMVVTLMDIKHTLDVYNYGPSAARNTVVELEIPIGLTFKLSSKSHMWLSTDSTGTTVQWLLGDVPPGTSGHITLDVTSAADLCADVVFDFSVWSDTSDPNPSNNTGQKILWVTPCSPDGGGTPPGGGDVEAVCCLPDGTCMKLNATDCDSVGGAYISGETNCADVDCGKLLVGDCPKLSSRIVEICRTVDEISGSVTVHVTAEMQNTGAGDAQNAELVAHAGWGFTGPNQTLYAGPQEMWTGMLPAGQTVTCYFVLDLGVAPDWATFHPYVTVAAWIDDLPCDWQGEERVVTIDPDGSIPLCPPEDDEPGDRTIDPEGGTSTEPEPEPVGQPNLWVTDMSGCWTWSDDGREHVMATVTGIVHNGGQADASNVRARVTANGVSDTVNVGTLPAGGQRSVSATIDAGAYDGVSWPLATSITADPLHQIDEADESNNTTNSSFPQSSDCN